MASKIQPDSLKRAIEALSAIQTSMDPATRAEVIRQIEISQFSVGQAAADAIARFGIPEMSGTEVSAQILEHLDLGTGIQEGVQETSDSPAPALEQSSTVKQDPTEVERADRNNICRAWKTKRKRLQLPYSDEAIAKLANPERWSERTPVMWWKAMDPRSKEIDNKRIRAVFNNPKTLQRF